MKMSSTYSCSRAALTNDHKRGGFPHSDVFSSRLGGQMCCGCASIAAPGGCQGSAAGNPCCCCVVPKSCPTLCDSMNCNSPLSMRFPRQEYWSGLPFPSPGNPWDSLETPHPGFYLRLHISSFSVSSLLFRRTPIIELSQQDFVLRSLMTSAGALIPKKTTF